MDIVTFTSSKSTFTDDQEYAIKQYEKYERFEDLCDKIAIIIKTYWLTPISLLNNVNFLTLTLHNIIQIINKL